MIHTTAPISLLRLLLVLVSLAGFCVPVPIKVPVKVRRITIGFRTVSPEQGQAYNDQEYLTYTGARARTRVGHGVYLTDGPGDWKGNKGDWYCHMTAREDEWLKVPKIWIPEEDDCGAPLWHEGDQVIDKYIEDLSEWWIYRYRTPFPRGFKFTPAFAVRLAELFIDKPANLILVPPALLPPDGGRLKIRAWCSPHLSDMPEKKAKLPGWGKIGFRSSTMAPV